MSKMMTLRTCRMEVELSHVISCPAPPRAKTRMVIQATKRSRVRQLEIFKQREAGEVDRAGVDGVVRGRKVIKERIWRRTKATKVMQSSKRSPPPHEGQRDPSDHMAKRLGYPMQVRRRQRNPIMLAAFQIKELRSHCARTHQLSGSLTMTPNRAARSRTESSQCLIKRQKQRKGLGDLQRTVMHLELDVVARIHSDWQQSNVNWVTMFF
mmetsp:Transcript_759/g.1107  ORF Transcript_759/g.1107 Transcript_759/m.1107 type:complete len:210 (+) Transcript_759:1908-2537(+)